MKRQCHATTSFFLIVMSVLFVYPRLLTYDKSYLFRPVFDLFIKYKPFIYEYSAIKQLIQMYWMITAVSLSVDRYRESYNYCVDYARELLASPCNLLRLLLEVSLSCGVLLSLH